ncbi:MAG TPA: serine/threonine-protein phosphatase, partial [Candidatus Galloscillospira excrementavium]|nr:serine/threonine-protein phosphatase [Candidatus Galloscillospira excrementavium]
MIRVWGVTDRGAVRQQNQDAYYIGVPSQSLALCVVCDGMGGAKAG